MAKFNSLRALLALVSDKNWKQEGMDVKTAFLHSELEERVFMHIPEGLHGEAVSTSSEPPLVCQPKKSIYGLKQSPRAWYGKCNMCTCSSNGTQERAVQDLLSLVDLYLVYLI